MKILHTADLHLGSVMTSRLSSEKARERGVELFTSFERLAGNAVLHGARLFIIAGDLFDTQKLSTRNIDRVIDVIAGHPHIDFLYLPGNHEKNALSESGRALPNNLKIFGKEWTYFEYDDVVIAGKSEISANMFTELKVNEAKKNVLVLHGAVADRSGADNVGLREARGLGIDYIALGHYHSYDTFEVDDRCTAVYSGTPEGRGFDECGEKGYVIIDTERGRVTHEFHKSAKRTVHIKNVDISYLSKSLEVQDAVAKGLYEIPSSDLVRVVISGRRAQDLFPDRDGIASKYRDKFYYFEVKDESKTAIDMDAFKYDKSLKGEFMRLCLADTELSDEDREEVIRAGISALLNIDIEI